MNWKAFQVKEQPERIVLVMTENLHEGVRDEDRETFASALAHKVTARLRRVGYRKVSFTGRPSVMPTTKEELGKVVWGAQPGKWGIHAWISGGRWQYHAEHLTKLIVDESNRMLAELTLHYVQQDAAKTSTEEAQRAVDAAKRTVEVEVKVDPYAKRIIMPGKL